jgi:hypothetical protein
MPRRISTIRKSPVRLSLPGKGLDELCPLTTFLGVGLGISVPGKVDEPLAGSELEEVQ